MGHLSIVSGRTETDTEDYHHSFIFLCFSNGGYTFLSKAALSNTTPIAKSICENNFLQRIMASGAVADV